MSIGNQAAKADPRYCLTEPTFLKCAFISSLYLKYVQYPSLKPLGSPNCRKSYIPLRLNTPPTATFTYLYSACRISPPHLLGFSPYHKQRISDKGCHPYVLSSSQSCS